ncbi:MAG TPA: DUF3011 domain-containing protein [Lysobacter sp.]
MNNTRHARHPLPWMIVLALAGWSGWAWADYNVTCESRDNRHQSCPLDQGAGYVSMDRKLSSSSCDQGRNWDYNRREVWVDDGCRATFKVHTGGSGHGSDHDAKVAAGVIAGAVLLGALMHNGNKDDQKYRDDNYYGGGHTSYIPAWMVGDFVGYNAMYNATVRMTIQPDGQMNAVANGKGLSGWINDGQLHVGNEVFTVNQSGDGFVTSQVGDHYNQVRYSRVR